MARSTINPDPSCVQLEGIHPHADGLTIILRTSRACVLCPDCSQPADGVHSWYQRTLADLPWQGVAVRFHLYTRRWFCRNSVCSRSIFTERLPALVEVYARRTNWLAEVVEAVAFAIGGEAGSRLLLTLILKLSPDTLLNSIRSAELPAGQPLHWRWNRSTAALFATLQAAKDAFARGNYRAARQQIDSVGATCLKSSGRNSRLRRI